MPWESPDGGSKTFVFHRPELPVLPPAAMAEWIKHDPGQGCGGKGSPRVWEEDTITRDDLVCPVSVAPGGASVSVTIENHLPGLLTTSGDPWMVLNGGLDGNCIELFAAWQWREVIQKLKLTETVQADGSTVPGPPTEVAFRYKYHWEASCVTKVCPC